MAAKITAFIATFGINVILGIVIFFFMLLAMNGFSESDAMWGLGAYALLSVIVIVLASVAAVFVVRMLIAREFREWIAAIIAIPIFCTIGTTLTILSAFIGIMIAEYVRVKY